MKRILVFTGGGIAPALNATLYGVITAAKRRGWRVAGGFFGWASLLPDGHMIDATRLDVTPIRYQGGSFLRSSRTNPLANRQTTHAVLAAIARHRFDGIVAIGGDDTLGAAHTLATKYHLPIVGVPKTIDNDLSATYFTPGFPTAAHVLARYSDTLKQAAYGVRRIFVIEVLGGKAGWLSAATALGGADVIIPPERPIPLSRVIARTRARYRENNAAAVVVVAAHARIGSLRSAYAAKRDAYGITRAHLISVPLRNALEKAISADTVIALPANMVSAADPIALDQRIAEALGTHVIALLAQGRYGNMVAVGTNLRPTTVPLARAVDKRAYRALGDRDFDFARLYPRAPLLRYLERLTGITVQKEKPYARFLKKFEI